MHTMYTHNGIYIYVYPCTYTLYTFMYSRRRIYLGRERERKSDSRPYKPEAGLDDHGGSRLITEFQQDAKS